MSRGFGKTVLATVPPSSSAISFSIRISPGVLFLFPSVFTLFPSTPKMSIGAAAPAPPEEVEKGREKLHQYAYRRSGPGAS